MHCFAGVYKTMLQIRWNNLNINWCSRFNSDTRFFFSGVEKTQFVEWKQWRKKIVAPEIYKIYSHGVHTLCTNYHEILYYKQRFYKFAYFPTFLNYFRLNKLFQYINLNYTKTCFSLLLIFLFYFFYHTLYLKLTIYMQMSFNACLQIPQFYVLA